MNVERQRNHVKALKKEWAEAIQKYGVGSFGEERRANELWREEKKLRKMEAEEQEMKKVVDEIEDWEDYETIDEARNEIKRLLEENARLREVISHHGKCFREISEQVRGLHNSIFEC